MMFIFILYRLIRIWHVMYRKTAQWISCALSPLSTVLGQHCWTKTYICVKSCVYPPVVLIYLFHESRSKSQEYLSCEPTLPVSVMPSSDITRDTFSSWKQSIFISTPEMEGVIIQVGMWQLGKKIDHDQIIPIKNAYSPLKTHTTPQSRSPWLSPSKCVKIPYLGSKGFRKVVTQLFWKESGPSCIILALEASLLWSSLTSWEMLVI